MRKKILVKAPALSQSGYGEQSRFALRALRSQEEKYDIYLHLLNWGATSWQWRDDEERKWVDFIIKKTASYLQSGNKHFDVSLQITIPNEWEKIADVNIGYTAGIETTRVSPQWIEKSLLMDKIIVISKHSKDIYEGTSYQAKDPSTGQTIENFSCTTPIDVVNYPVRRFEPEEFDLNLEYDFNFLTVAQWSPRKNLEKTIKWFVEEFIDQEVGLILKCNVANNSLIDFEFTKEKINSLLKNKEYEGRKCKIHILHGNLSAGELAYLYTHDKVKALLSLSHGEGYGLPLFEASYYGLPVISTEWSGQADFLFAEVERKKGKKKKRPCFASVSYDIRPIPKEAIWDGVLQKDSAWCYPREGSAKMKMRDVRKNYGIYKKQANTLKKYVLEKFEESKINQQMVESIFGDINQNDQEIDDIFAELSKAHQ